MTVAAPITLCIINYNGEPYLQRTLLAAQRSSVRFAEVVLVDDASTDRSLELVRACYPEARIVTRERNGGPGAARNDGFRLATRDLILFADNDVELDPECAGRLRAELAARPGALVAMPRVLYAERPDTIQYEGAECHFLGLMMLRHHRTRIDDAPSSSATTGSVVTCAFMVDRSRWQGGPPFDATFIFNLEDHDFGIRSRIMGHTLVTVPTATCLHGDGTPGLSYRGGQVQSPTRVYCLIRNRWRIVLQTYAGRSLLLLAPCLLLYEVFQLAGAAREGWLRSWVRAAGWMLAHPGVTMRRRREVQRSRRAPDRDLLIGGALPFTPGLLTGKVERAVRQGLERLMEWYWGLVRGMV